MNSIRKRVIGITNSDYYLKVRFVCNTLFWYCVSFTGKFFRRFGFRNIHLGISYENFAIP